MPKIISIILAGIFVSSCATTSPVINPNKIINIYGVSLLPPQHGSWRVMTVSGYQLALASVAANKNESLVANISIYQLPEFSSEAEFLSHITQYRAATPNIGRFELQNNSEVLRHLMALFASSITSYQKIIMRK